MAMCKECRIHDSTGIPGNYRKALAYGIACEAATRRVFQPKINNLLHRKLPVGQISIFGKDFDAYWFSLAEVL